MSNLRNPITEPTIYKIMMLLRKGGKVISAQASTPDEWAAAVAEKRIFIDDDGFGYLYVKEGKT